VRPLDGWSFQSWGLMEPLVPLAQMVLTVLTVPVQSG
jgi:hypothetical protein